MSFVRPVFALAGLLVAAGFGTSDANAQQIYRIEGSDGKLTFSDKAPLEPNPRATATAKAVPLPMPGTATDNGTLPFQVRQVADRYPVTLYTSAGCAPCANGRAMLSARGIPFNEKTVASNEDIEALKRLSGAASVPFLTVGGQQLKGFSEIEWTQFLDAAGYPKTSQLPTSYSPPPATPLVAAQAPTRPAPSQAAPRAAPPPLPAPAATSGDNPAGIRF
jgi:glutaredoxin